MDIKQIVCHIYNISCKTVQLKVALDKESSYFLCRSGKNKAMMNSRATKRGRYRSSAEDSKWWGGCGLPHPRHLTPFPGSQDALQKQGE